jgi:formylmethanofuran dehydrogenase subunit E
MADDADRASDEQALHLRVLVARRFQPPSARLECEECTLPMAYAEMVVVAGRKLCQECAEWL